MGVTLCTLLTRFWHLGAWPISGDEGFTLGSSTTEFSWRDLRPLPFAMNRYLAIPLFGPTEFALRFFPALFGVAAVPLFGWLVGRRFGRASGLATALLILGSPMLLLHSQFARYYMQSFVLAGVAAFSIPNWVEDEGRPRWLVVAVLAMLAGWFMVPSSAFILPGFLWWAWLNRKALAGSPVGWWTRTHRRIVWAGLTVCAVGFVLLILRIRQAYTSGELLTGVRYFPLPSFVLSTVAGFSIPLLVAGALGLILLWRDQTLTKLDRTLLPTLAVGSIATYLGAFPFLAVGPAHVISVGILAFAGAGCLLGRVYDTAGRPWTAAALGLVIVLIPLRQFASHFVDGSRTDYRTAAAQLETWVTEDPGPVLALAHGNLNLYGPTLRSQELHVGWDSIPLVDDHDRSAPAWIVVTEHRRGLDIDESSPAVQRLLAVCALKSRVHRQRLDYHLNAVRIYRCPPHAAGP